MIENQENWFVARTRKDQEFSVRDSLTKWDTECYLPTHTVVRQLKYRRKRVEIPVIRNLIFLHATKQKACSLVNDFGVQMFYMRDFATGSMLVVPEKQMRDFRFVMDLDPTCGAYDCDDFAPGDKVRVVKGDFAGIEGELLSISGRTHVVIRVAGLLAVKVKIPKKYLELI